MSTASGVESMKYFKLIPIGGKAEAPVKPVATPKAIRVYNKRQSMLKGLSIRELTARIEEINEVIPLLKDKEQIRELTNFRVALYVRRKKLQKYEPKQKRVVKTRYAVPHGFKLVPIEPEVAPVVVPVVQTTQPAVVAAT